MAKIEIALINAQDGQSWPAEVVTDKPVGWWVDQILQALNLPREENGRHVHYQFVLECSGQVVGEEETLQSADVQVGDRLRLERVQVEIAPGELLPARAAPPAEKPAKKIVLSVWLKRMGVTLAAATILGFIGWWLVYALTDRKLHTIHIGQNNGTDVAFSSDGNILATNNPKSPWGLILWDTHTGRQLRALPSEAIEGCCYPSIVFSPSGTFLAGSLWGEWGVLLFDLRAGRQQVLEPQAELSEDMSVAISPDETMLATVSAYGAINLWDLRTGQLLWTWKGNYLPTTIGDEIPIDFSPDGTILASVIGLECESEASEPCRLISLWNVKTGQQIRTLGPYWDVNGIVFSPDGQMMIVSDDSACLVNIQNPEQERCLSGFYFRRVAISADVKKIAIGNSPNYGEIQLLDVKSGEELYVLKGHPHNEIARLAFSQDGMLLASASHDGTVIIWDTSP
jgi:WD40 repeat protein